MEVPEKSSPKIILTSRGYAITQALIEIEEEKQIREAIDKLRSLKPIIQLKDLY